MLTVHGLITELLNLDPSLPVVLSGEQRADGGGMTYATGVKAAVAVDLTGVLFDAGKVDGKPLVEVAVIR